MTSIGSDLSTSLTESDLAELPKVLQGVVHVASHTRRTASHTRRTDSHTRRTDSPPQRSAIPPSERELRSASVHSQSLDTPKPRNRPESRSESTSPEIPLKR